MGNILICGASSGIGRTTAELLAKNNHNIILVSRNITKLEEIKVSLSPGSHCCLNFDFENTEYISDFVDNVISQHGQIDSLIYCVGNGVPLKLKDLTYHKLIQYYNSNVFSFFELIRCLIKKNHTSESIFKIFAISSLAATHSNTKYYIPYSTSKAALESSARIFAPELYKKKASITILKPGYVNTPRLEYDSIMHPDLDGYLKETNYQPCGIIPCKTVAEFIVFLLSLNDFSFNGAILPIPSGAVS